MGADQKIRLRVYNFLKSAEEFYRQLFLDILRL